jgi:hypothetical protein
VSDHKDVRLAELIRRLVRGETHTLSIGHYVVALGAGGAIQLLCGLVAP